jgi:predicted  nucleic acid-binding Zn-ribbon protein
MKQIFNVVLVLFVWFFFTAAASVSGQTRTPPDPLRDDDRQVLRALLDEMRELRLALQRANVASYRLQVTLERIKLQQGRMDSFSRALESVRSRLSDLKSSRPQMEEQIKYAEDLLNSTTDLKRRGELEQEIRAMKAHQSSRAREEEQSRNREAELILELQLEQAKLTDLNNQLDSMVRQLETP